MIFSLKTVFSKRKNPSWYMIMPANIAKCYLCACVEGKAIEKWKKNCVKKSDFSVKKRVLLSAAFANIILTCHNTRQYQHKVITRHVRCHLHEQFSSFSLFTSTSNLALNYTNIHTHTLMTTWLNVSVWIHQRRRVNIFIYIVTRRRFCPLLFYFFCAHILSNAFIIASFRVKVASLARKEKKKSDFLL